MPGNHPDNEAKHHAEADDGKPRRIEDDRQGVERAIDQQSFLISRCERPGGKAIRLPRSAANRTLERFGFAANRNGSS